MDVTPLKDWLAVIGALISIGAAIYAMLTARASRALAEVARIDLELSTIKTRVLKVETSIEPRRSSAPGRGHSINRPRGCAA
jgi:hypothetical protein